MAGQVPGRRQRKKVCAQPLKPRIATHLNPRATHPELVLARG